MNWDRIVGQRELKNQLVESIGQNRVGHAQLFVGKDGYGTLALALAYAREILSRENPSAGERVDSLNHVDLHFSFPVFSLGKDKALSKFFYENFRSEVLENPYFTLDDWNEKLESQNKQLFISVAEVEEWSQNFSLKSFEGGSKILIVWNADRIREDASNKLLKFLEEPPEKTVIILTAESDANFLPTILSRTQLVKVPRIDDEDLRDYFTKNSALSEGEIAKIIFQAQGDMSEALKISKARDVSTEFETLFVQWVREAFQVAKKPEFLRNIIRWARNIAGWNREKQKNFLDYCAENFRLALMQNYGSSDLVYRKIEMQKFNWDSFSKFVHGANIENILEELSNAEYHLQRNANSKLVWTDLGIKLSRYIHKKA